MSRPGIGEKVGFYFSVQTGGSFDIDYAVQDPNEKVILEGQAERQGDYIFTANTVGNIFSNVPSLTVSDYAGLFTPLSLSLSV